MVRLRLRSAHALSLFVDFRRCRGGSFATMAAMIALVLIGLVGGVTDLLIFRHHKSELQSTADSAVLAAAAEAGLKGWDGEAAKQVVSTVVASNLTNHFSASAEYVFDVLVSKPDRRIEVTLTQDHYGYFFLGYFAGSPQIAVQATARAMGQEMICIIVQSPNNDDAFELSGNSNVTASGCSAYSNSIKSKAINAKDTSRLTTRLACSAGGYTGKPANYAPVPLTDCPAIGDPLAARAKLIDSAIAGAACDHKKLKLEGVKKTLTPGTYCGGVEINKASVIHFDPGIYVFRDGKLKVDGLSSIDGEDVGFVFTGDKAKLELKNGSIISMSAPSSGPMSGLLLYAQPSKETERDFKIESKNAKKLIGTVYLPKDNLVIGGDKDGDGLCDPTEEDDGTFTPPTGPNCLSDVGATSSWTAIVANELKVTAGSALVINSDYAGSDVPVPKGLGPSSNKTLLIE